MCVGRRFLSAEEQFGSVTKCDCGTIHLRVGAVSVALDVGSLKQLHSLVRRAMEQLATEAAGIANAEMGPSGSPVH